MPMSPYARSLVGSNAIIDPCALPSTTARCAVSGGVLQVSPPSVERDCSRTVFVERILSSNVPSLISTAWHSLPPSMRLLCFQVIPRSSLNSTKLKKRVAFQMLE